MPNKKKEKMYDLISLNVKCLICEKSLMDKQKLIDGRRSIKLNIEISGKNGIIYLSSVYGSFNFVCDIETPNNEISKLFCPHCKNQLSTIAECENCQVPMTTFTLTDGGKVSICPRIGCKNHFLEFDDFSQAIKKLEDKNGYKDTPNREVLKESQKNKEIIKSGAFLQTFCPHCRKTLLENNLVRLKINSKDNEIGYIMLSPYLNIFTSISTIFLHEDKVINDILCPSCDVSIIEEVIKCEKCNSPVAKINVVARTKFVDFYICSRKGCQWHGINKQDLHNIELEDSLEW